MFAAVEKGEDPHGEGESSDLSEQDESKAKGSGRLGIFPIIHSSSSHMFPTVASDTDSPAHPLMSAAKRKAARDKEEKAKKKAKTDAAAAATIDEDATGPLFAGTTATDVAPPPLPMRKLAKKGDILLFLCWKAN